MAGTVNVTVNPGILTAYLDKAQQADQSYMHMPGTPVWAWTLDEPLPSNSRELGVMTSLAPLHAKTELQKDVKVVGLLMDPSTAHIRSSENYYMRRQGTLWVEGQQTVNNVEGPVRVGDPLIARIPDTTDLDPSTKKHVFKLRAATAAQLEESPNMYVGVAMASVPDGVRGASIVMNVRPFF